MKYEMTQLEHNPFALMKKTQDRSFQAHLDERARQGWRLHSTSSAVHNGPTGDKALVYMFWEKAR